MSEFENLLSIDNTTDTYLHQDCMIMFNMWTMLPNLDLIEKPVHRWDAPSVHELCQLMHQCQWNDHSQVNIIMYRDVYVDQSDYTLLSQGRWLRKRFTHSNRPPVYTLLNHHCINNIEHVGAKAIKANALPCAHLCVQYPHCVFTCDVMQLAYRCQNRVLNITIVRTDNDTYRVSATTYIASAYEKIMHALSPLPLQQIICHPSTPLPAAVLSSLSSIDDALECDFIYAGDDLFEKNTWLKNKFIDFANTFHVPHGYDPMEDDPNFGQDVQ